MVQGIVTVIHRIVLYAALVASTVILLLAALTTCDAIGRFFFNRPIIGAAEISQYMLVVIVLLGVGYTQQMGRHVRVESFANRLPTHLHLAVDLIFNIIAFVFFGLVVWQGWEAIFVARRLKQASAILGIPSYPFEAFVPAGVFLLSVVLLLNLVTSMRRPKNP